LKVYEFLDQLDPREWIAVLLARLTVGVPFFESGRRKLYRLNELVEYFAHLGIPFPHIQAPMVAGIEFAGGIFLSRDRIQYGGTVRIRRCKSPISKFLGDR
jgi:hypothetical protein